MTGPLQHVSIYVSVFYINCCCDRTRTACSHLRSQLFAYAFPKSLFTLCISSSTPLVSTFECPAWHQLNDKHVRVVTRSVDSCLYALLPGILWYRKRDINSERFFCPTAPSGHACIWPSTYACCARTPRLGVQLGPPNNSLVPHVIYISCVP